VSQLGPETDGRSRGLWLRSCIPPEHKKEALSKTCAGRVAIDPGGVIQYLAGDVQFACTKPVGSLTYLDLAVCIATLLALVDS
jgi:hypothetical protein